MSRPVILAVVSDLHLNSTVALCPPEGVTLDDGGTYEPSRLQRWLWDCWEDYWTQVRARLEAERAELWVVYNGDLFDGLRHHDTTQVISAHPEPQQYVADRVFSVPKALRPAHQFVVRGTESHVGPSGSTEEAWARALGAERNTDTGRWSWWVLRLEPQGVLVDCRHHGRTGVRPWTRGNPTAALALEIYLEHATRGWPPPRYAIRSHRHTYVDSGDVHPVRVIQTPAWQMATAYGHRVSPERPPDIGGLILTIRSREDHQVQAIRYTTVPGPSWTPSRRPRQ